MKIFLVALISVGHSSTERTNIAAFSDRLKADEEAARLNKIKEEKQQKLWAGEEQLKDIEDGDYEVEELELIGYTP